MTKDLKQTKLLIKKAQHDIIAMQKLQTDDVPEDVFGFHAQQAVEKLLKAWINLFDVEYPLIHNLSELYRRLFDLDSSVGEFHDLVFLTPYSVILRYEELGYETDLDRVYTLKRVELLFEKISTLAENAA